jgi:hypothetical protein
VLVTHGHPYYCSAPWKNSAQAIAGNAVAIVHTQAAFNTKAHQVAPQKGPEPRRARQGGRMMDNRFWSHAKSLCLAGLLSVAIAGAASAQKKYDPGATDTEIKLGNIMPYSGPASAYATIGKTEAAYFNKINAEGGINGRKINFVSYDDGYSPPKTVEQARKLVENDEVLLVFNPLGRQAIPRFRSI